VPWEIFGSWAYKAAVERRRKLHNNGGHIALFLTLLRVGKTQSE